METYVRVGDTIKKVDCALEQKSSGTCYEGLKAEAILEDGTIIDVTDKDIFVLTQSQKD